MAEQLIRTTSMQISEIAANVGFFDYNYFSKVFHRKFGVSPREYRKRLEDNGTGQEKQLNKANQTQKSIKNHPLYKITSPNTNFLLFWYRRTKAAGGIDPA